MDLTARQAARRLVVHGRNELTRRGKRRWPGELAAQFVHPLALLLAAAAILAVLSGSPVLGAAIAAVIVLNAAFAFFQEQHAEHAVEALAAYLPSHAAVWRDGARHDVEAADLVPGDVLIVEEGDRISADARLIAGSLEVDLSTLTGESQPAIRTAGRSILVRTTPAGACESSRSPTTVSTADQPCPPKGTRSSRTCACSASLPYSILPARKSPTPSRAPTRRGSKCSSSPATMAALPPRSPPRSGSAPARPVAAPSRPANSTQ